jgi:hypothetical protein
MAVLVVHPWAQFFTGMLIGCWIGAAVACAGVLLMVGRKVRRLESINLLLRTKLKARVRMPRSGTGTSGSMLVMPLPGTSRRPQGPTGKIARVN